MRVANVETFIFTVPRDTPYLGPLGPGERVNSRGYIVRKGNGTIYPTVDRSVVVRVTTDDGRIGWGETYGICDPEDVEAIWDDLYGLMRVRGCFGGFNVDAIAALDIALWDLRAKGRGMPLWQLLGERRRERVPGYLSGLPAGSLEERVAMARRLQSEGHDAFKIHTVVSFDGIVEEAAALREALGPDVALMIDLHWKFDVEQALEMAERLAPLKLQFLEAPLKPEDVSGLAELSRRSPIALAAGEEWHTEYEARLRLDRDAIAYVQPEMGHTGITQFLRIARMANARGVSVAPHATIGVGLFLAASLHAASVVENLWRHEWQHSIFGRSLRMLETDMAYEDNHYRLPTGSGLGASPNERFWEFAQRVE